MMHQPVIGRLKIFFVIGALIGFRLGFLLPLCQAQQFPVNLSQLDLQISALEGLPDAQSQLTQIDLLLKKADILRERQFLDDAILAANHALLVANELQSESVLERVNYSLSRCYIGKNLFLESLDYLYKGCQLAEALRDTSKIGWYLLQIVECEDYLGRLSHSMNINLRAIDFFKLIDDNESLGRVYRAHAVVHMSMANYKTAELYLNRALKLIMQTADSLQIGRIYLLFAELQLLQNNVDEAQQAVAQAQTILSERDHRFVLRGHDIEAAILLKQRKTLQAITLLTTTTEQQKAIDDHKGLAISFLMLGDLYQRTGDYERAIQSYNCCIKCASEQNLTNFVRKSYQGLAVIHGKSVRYEQAYFDLSRYVSITDSLYNLQTIGEANRLENQTVMRAKEREIAQQNELLLKNKKTLKREKVKQIFLYVLIALLFTTVWFAFRESKQKKKTNAILTRTNAEIELQKKTLEQRNRDIKDSLNYAKRIQTAVLHTTHQINDFFSDSFLIFEPKELVSGDFYWFKKVGNQLLFAVADCTGHGAPGAYMSVIGTFGLNQIVNELGETRPVEILNNLNELFFRTIEQRAGAEIFDGMDIGLCNFNSATNEIIFAGANIGLYILRKSTAPAASSIVLHQSHEYTLYQTKFTKQSIGYVQNRIPFVTQGLKLLPGDRLYLLSDGFTDQFGGPRMKKLGYANLRTMLCDIASLPMIEQKDVLLKYFHTWKGETMQIDDVTFLGIRIPN